MPVISRRNDGFSKWNGAVVKRATPFSLEVTKGIGFKVGMEILDEKGETFVVSSISSIFFNGTDCVVTGNCRKLKEVAKRHGRVYAKERSKGKC